MDLVAPSGKSGTAIEEGTSFATPQVTGTILLLQQMYRQAFGTLPTVDQLDGWLSAGADKIHDAVTGIDLGRLNVAGSLGLLADQIQATAATVMAKAVTAVPVVTTPAVSVPVVAPSVLSLAAEVVEPTVVTPTVVVAPTLAITDTTTVPVVAPSVAVPVVTPPTTTTVTATAPTRAEPQTEVFINGASVGKVSTSRLAERYARLFALTKGNTKELRAWAPPGSVIDLGTVQPSGKVAHPKAAVFSVRARQADHPNKIVTHGVAHPTRVSKLVTSPGKPTVAAVGLVTAQVLRGYQG